MDPRALVLYGQGINCDNETSRILESAGARPEKVLLSQLVTRRKRTGDYDMLAIPGGFSYSDDLGAGTVMAVYLKHGLGDDILEFVQAGKPVIGICNGFQMLVKLGLLPGLNGDYRTRKAALTNNDSGMFEDRWVRLAIDSQSPCIFTKGIDWLELPVRHGEGKFYAEPQTIGRIKEGRLAVARYAGPDGEANPGYPWNPNGSLDDIAGICDPTGMVFGLMPHPEAATEVHHHPAWTRDRAAAEDNAARARQMIRNAVEYVRG